MTSFTVLSAASAPTTQLFQSRVATSSAAVTPAQTLTLPILPAGECVRLAVDIVGAGPGAGPTVAAYSRTAALITSNVGVVTVHNLAVIGTDVAGGSSVPTFVPGAGVPTLTINVTGTASTNWVWDVYTRAVISGDLS